MKNTPLILSIIALVAVAALGIAQLVGGQPKAKPAGEAGTEEVANKGAIVYFNLDRVMNEYDKANELKTAVDSKIQGIEQEINRRGNRIQNDFNAFNEKINKGLMTRSVAEVQGQKLEKQRQDFSVYADQKQREIVEEQQVMMNQIADAIKTFVDKYNEQMGYALIVANQGDILPLPIATADPSLDITDAIIAGLNDEYIKEKAKGSSAKSETASETK